MNDARRMKLRPTHAAVMIVALLGAQGAATTGIHGVVRDPSGAPLPGVKVAAMPTSGPPGLLDFSKTGGTYELRLRPGTYTLTAHLDGFCAPARPLTVVAAQEPARVDWTLHLAAPDIVDRVVLSLPELFAIVDAVVHVRITRSHPPRPIDPEGCGAGNVLTEHEVDVVATIKADAELWPAARRVRFIQRRAGSSFEGRRAVRGPERPHTIGEEFVAFLHWSAEDTRLGPHWEPFEMVPIRDGAVRWGNRRQIAGVPDGMAVEELLRQLRGLATRSPSS